MRLEALIAERDELRERVRVLEGILCDTDWCPTEWKLTAMEKKLLNILVERSVITRDEIHDSLYYDREDGGPDDRRIVPLFIHRIRKKLEPFGMSVVCQGRGRGSGGDFCLPAETRKYMQSLKRGVTRLAA